MRKLLALVFVFAMIFSGCGKQKETWDHIPLLYFENTFFAQKSTVLSSPPKGYVLAGKTTKAVPAGEAPPEENGASNALYEGTAIYVNPDSPEIIYAEFEEGKFIAFEIFEDISSESTAFSENSGYENPYTSCVPERSLESSEPDPSYVHSSETSSSEPLSESYSINGRTTEIYPPEEENIDFILGSAIELERWKTAINNLSEVSEIVVCYIETEERSLDFSETTEIINNLRSLSPDIKPEMDNPSTGGSFTVYAYDSEGNPLWRVSPGYWFVLGFGEENILYVFDSEGQDLSAIFKILDYRSPLSHP